MNGLPSEHMLSSPEVIFEKFVWVLRIWIAVSLAFEATARLKADSLTLLPTADTTLIEAAPDNNLGAQTYFNAGTTERLTRNRALLKFDLSSIPARSILRSASLTLQVVHEPNNGFNSSEMELHRVLRPWGEGDKSATTSPGLGAPAGTNEATLGLSTSIEWRDVGSAGRGVRN